MHRASPHGQNPHTQSQGHPGLLRPPPHHKRPHPSHQRTPRTPTRLRPRTCKTSPTTSPEHSPKPENSNPNHTPNYEEPVNMHARRPRSFPDTRPSGPIHACQPRLKPPCTAAHNPTHVANAARQVPGGTKTTPTGTRGTPVPPYCLLPIRWVPPDGASSCRRSERASATDASPR